MRLPAADRGWVGALPEVPDGHRLTVTVGHRALLPVSARGLSAKGYRLVGMAAEHRPIGHTVDVLVPAELRIGHPVWWKALTAEAERVFDLRHGPVLRVLAAELELHLRPADEPSRLHG